MKISIIKSLLLPIIFGGSVLGSVALFPKPAQTQQWWEHMIYYSPNSSNQATADQNCRSSVNSIIDHNGWVSDVSHGGYIIFQTFSRPYVWAHLGYNRCLVNASWGYVKYGQP